MFQLFEDNEDAVLGCERLGQTLKTAIEGCWSRPRSGGGVYTAPTYLFQDSVVEVQ
jgi:hypothetical protein